MRTHEARALLPLRPAHTGPVPPDCGQRRPQRPRRRLQRGDGAPLRAPPRGGGPHTLPQRSLASQLYWGADYSVGSGGFDTRFSYGEAIDCRDERSGRSVYGVEFGAGTFFSGSLNDNDAIDAIFSGLAERALAAGAGRYEDYSETIYLADYFDYYPVDAYAIPSSEREGFAEFFRVPVLPGDSIDVSVSGVTPAAAPPAAA